MATKKEYLENILLLEKWFENKVSTLECITKVDDAHAIKFSDGRGNDVPLPEEHRKGFMMGLRLSLEILGEFPLTIEKVEKTK